MIQLGCIVWEEAGRYTNSAKGELRVHCRFCRVGTAPPAKPPDPTSLPQSMDGWKDWASGHLHVPHGASLDYHRVALQLILYVLGTAQGQANWWICHVPSWREG
jgi:hypothetical protein